MGRLLILVGVVLALLALFAVSKPSEEVADLPPSTPRSVDARAGEEIVVNENSYRVFWAEADAQALSLIPNFEEKKTSNTVFTEAGCKVLVNGGFYTAGANSAYIDEGAPIGYFVADGEVFSEYAQNRLFDGILSINGMATPRITRGAPVGEPMLALQTGPLLVENNQTLEVPETNNKYARRMLAAVTGENKLVFIAVYDRQSFFGGPLISELPQVVSEFERVSGLDVADAINLDGGSASAMVTDEFSLSEASPVGSYFCGR